MANFDEAVAEARALYPEFRAAFDTLENSQYQQVIYLRQDTGRYKLVEYRHYGHLTFDVHAGRLYATVRFPGQTATAELQWIPFSRPGIATRGFWGHTQFSTPLTDFAVGELNNPADAYRVKLHWEVIPPLGGSILRPVRGLELEAYPGDRDSIDRAGESYGTTRESLSAQLRQIEEQSGTIRFPDTEDLVIYESLADATTNAAGMIDGLLFHTFANSLFDTNNATPEQIEAVTNAFFHRATPAQLSRIEAAPSLAYPGTGRLALRYTTRGGVTGVWDLTNDCAGPERAVGGPLEEPDSGAEPGAECAPPVRVLLQALPEPGEPKATSAPYSGPTVSYHFDGERLVLRVFLYGDWRNFRSEVKQLAYGLRQPPDVEDGRNSTYNFLYEHTAYVFVENSRGERVIAPLEAYRIYK